jgi:protease-4
MSVDPDLIVDRRRLRRKLSFWRVVAIGLILLGIAAAAAAVSHRNGLVGAPYIARVTISGLIRDDEERVRQLDRLARAANVKAVILHVDSPGGTTAGSEQLFDALGRVRDKKPVAVVVDSLAASGAYVTALAGDYIVAKQTSLVGSIGVLFEYPNFADLLEKIGVKVESIKSSPLKAAPNGFEPTSPEARAAIQSIIMDSYAWFRGLVQDRRHLTEGQLAAVADGRVFTGHQALPLKLVDQIGDERAALAWLEQAKKVSASLPVRDFRLHSRFDSLPFLHAAAIAMLHAAGLDGFAERLGALGSATTLDGFNLDGLLALWQPADTK